MKNVLAKLLKIQQELKAPKGQYNSFGKYNYRSCEDILEAVKPIAHKYKAVVVLTDEIQQIGERFYLKATAALYDTESGEVVSNSALAREEETKKGMDGSQVTGTSSSYARKYALNGLFAIDDTKDADTNEHREIQNKSVLAAHAQLTAPAQQKQNQQTAKKPSEAQLKRMWAIAHEAGYEENAVHAFIEKKFSKKSVKELTLDEVNTIVERLENTKK